MIVIGSSVGRNTCLVEYALFSTACANLKSRRWPAHSPPYNIILQYFSTMNHTQPHRWYSSQTLWVDCPLECALNRRHWPFGHCFPVDMFFRCAKTCGPTPWNIPIVWKKVVPEAKRCATKGKDWREANGLLLTRISGSGYLLLLKLLLILLAAVNTGKRQRAKGNGIFCILLMLTILVGKTGLKKFVFSFEFSESALDIYFLMQW